MWIVETVGSLGYGGIFVMMFLESSFFPFPSEVVMPPAGYLAARGQMSMVLAILAGIAGSLGGALFNYYLASRWGRRLLLRYMKYVFIKESSLKRSEDFFMRHGHISTFVGRLIPGIRQYISLPAGLLGMPLFVFCLFTSLGAGIWVTILTYIGFFVGHNQELVELYLKKSSLFLVMACVIIVFIYVVRLKNTRR